MPRLGTLAEFQLDHLDLRVGGVGGKTLFAEGAVAVAAAKVARADLPDQVAAMLAVVTRDGALARVVREATGLGPLVQGQHGVGRQGAKAHGRDVEHTGVVGLGAGLHRGRGRIGAAADPHPEVVRGQLRGRHRVVHPFVAVRANIQLRAKRPVVGLALGALVHQRALRPRKRRRLAVAFNEVLAHFGPDVLQHEAQVADDRVVAQHGMPRLAQVVKAQAYQAPQHAGQGRQPKAEAEREQAAQR